MGKIIYENSEPVIHFDYLVNNSKYNKLTRENYAVIDKRTSFYFKNNPKAYEINKSDIDEGKVPRYDLALDKKGLTYTDEWCEKHREQALKNFDMNMEYYKYVGKNFEEKLNEFLLTDGSEFKEYYSLNHEDMKKPGIYMLVLGEYTQSGRTSAGFPLLFAKSYFKQSVPRRSTISSKFKFLSAMPKSSPLFAFLILFQSLKYFR